jgi:hypothetical protein
MVAETSEKVFLFSMKAVILCDGEYPAQINQIEEGIETCRSVYCC